jgi:hypothetical protein
MSAHPEGGNLKYAGLHSICKTKPIVFPEFHLNGLEFIDENGGGPGVRLRKRHQKKSYQGYAKKRRHRPLKH